MFFTGFLIREADIPVYWRYWAPYTDFIRHAWHAQMANQFSRRPDVLFAGVEPVLAQCSNACGSGCPHWCCTICHMLLRHVEFWQAI